MEASRCQQVDLLCFCSVLCCYVFVRVCLYVLCGHLLGKGWPLCSRLWCLLWVCHFPIGILGQVWYLIVSIPDLCTHTYFSKPCLVILISKGTHLAFSITKPQSSPIVTHLWNSSLLQEDIVLKPWLLWMGWDNFLLMFFLRFVVEEVIVHFWRKSSEFLQKHYQYLSSSQQGIALIERESHAKPFSSIKGHPHYGIV